MFKEILEKKIKANFCSNAETSFEPNGTLVNFSLIISFSRVKT